MKAPNAGGRPRFSRHARGAGRVLIVLGGAGAGVLALAGPAFAHVTITPGSAPQGSTAELTFKVPNEESTAATVELQVQVPTAHPIAQFLVKPVPGWTISVRTITLAKPVVTDDGSFSTAVSEVTWTGGKILPGQYQDFSVSADPLPSGVGQLVFKAVQTYSNGDVVRWIDLPQAGQPGARAPCSVSPTPRERQPTPRQARRCRLTCRLPRGRTRAQGPIRARSRASSARLPCRRAARAGRGRVGPAARAPGPPAMRRALPACAGAARGGRRGRSVGRHRRRAPRTRRDHGACHGGGAGRGGGGRARGAHLHRACSTAAW